MVVVCPNRRVSSDRSCHVGVLFPWQVRPQVRRLGTTRDSYGWRIRLLVEVGLALQETVKVLETLFNHVPWPLCGVCNRVFAWALAHLGVGRCRIPRSHGTCDSNRLG